MVSPSPLSTEQSDICVKRVNTGAHVCTHSHIGVSSEGPELIGGNRRGRKTT